MKKRKKKKKEEEESGHGNFCLKTNKTPAWNKDDCQHSQTSAKYVNGEREG